MLKSLLISAVFGILAYSTIMMIIRLRMTEMAYEFDQLKVTERALQEERKRLKTELARELSPTALNLKGFQEPNPDDWMVIP